MGPHAQAVSQQLGEPSAGTGGGPQAVLPFQFTGIQLPISRFQEYEAATEEWCIPRKVGILLRSKPLILLTLTGLLAS